MRGVQAPQASAGQPAPAAMVPFTAGAHEHTEPAFDVSFTPSTATQVLGPFDVPAYGYLRHIFLELTTTAAGTIGAGVLGADYPYNIFASVALNDVNGAPIFGPLDGYACLWTNIVGGYGFRSDPRTAPMYSAAFGTTTLWLRIPIEVSHHDGFGALPNQNASSNYKVAISIAPTTTIYSTVPTTPPTFRLRGYLEAWSLPNATDIAGRPQAQVPPMVGSTQYWSSNVKPVSLGQNNIKIDRVGNLIRNIVFINRNAAGARINTVFPDPATISWDARDILTDTQNYRTSVAHERLTPLAAAIDTGVFIYALDHSDHGLVGDDNATLWYATVQATRLELRGVTALAGNVQILINDIAPVEVDAADRFIEDSATGFNPRALGGTAPGQ